MKANRKRLLCWLLVMTMLMAMLPPALAVGTGAGAKVISQEAYDRVNRLWDQVCAAESNQLSQAESSTAFSDAVDIQTIAALVQNFPFYASDSLSWHNDDYFSFQTTDGIACGYNLSHREKLRETAAYKTESGVTEMPPVLTPASSSQTDIALIAPFYGYDTSFTDQYQRDMQDLAQATNGTYTLYAQTTATVDAIAEALGQARVVVFDSHGVTDYENPFQDSDSVSRANTSYLCITSGSGLTTADYAKVSGTYGTYHHAEDWGDYGSYHVYVVDGTVIANHMKRPAQGNLLWMAICLGMATDGLVKPLREKGVGVVYGYSQSVTFRYDYQWEDVFFSRLEQGDTVAQAAAVMKERVGRWDYEKQYPTISQARNNYCAFPIFVSAEDVYPGKGNVDDLQTVQAGWTLAEETDFPITAVANHPDWGTVHVTGRIIMAVPSQGYDTVGYAVTAGQAEVVQRGNEFEVTPATACTITIQFAAKTKARVTFQTPAGVQQSPIETYLGEEITLPMPAGAPTRPKEGYVFLGWTATPVDSVQRQPEYYKPGSAFRITKEEQKLHALYAYRTDAVGGPAAFTQVQTELQDWSGVYAVANPSYQVAMSSQNPTQTYLSAQSVKFQADKLLDPDASCIWVVEKVGAWYALRSAEGAYLKCENVKHVCLDQEKTQVTQADTAYLWALSAVSGAQPYLSAQGRIQYHVDTSKFTTYTENCEPAYFYSGQGLRVIYTTQLVQGVCPDGHTPELRNQKQATCTQDGYTGDQYCAVCGELLEPGTVVPALGHRDAVVRGEQAPSCRNEGYSGDTYCGVCGQCIAKGHTVPALDHAWGAWEMTAQPTCFTDGVQSRVCERCGQLEQVPVPANAENCPATKFQDVNLGQYYHEGLDFVLAHGYMNGTSETTFAPQAGLTRGMLVTILYRVAGTPAVSGASMPFTDVGKGSYYTAAVAWAYNAGIVTGTTETKFAPNAKITREQMTTILYRYAGHPQSKGDLSAFRDAVDVSAYAKAGMAWAVEHGIVHGVTPTTLAPQHGATRAQVATIIMRFLLNLEQD